MILLASTIIVYTLPSVSLFHISFLENNDWSVSGNCARIEIQQGTGQAYSSEYKNML